MGEKAQEPHFEDLIQSNLFTFYIGKERKQFVVHSKAISTTSEYFNALVNGHMMEAKTRSAEFLDVNPEDFARFLEYSYRREYTIPPCTEDEDGSVEGEDRLPVPAPVPYPHPDPPVPEPTGSPPEAPPLESPPPPPTFLISKKKSRSKYKLRAVFEKRDYLLAGNPRTTLSKNFEPQSNSSPREDFTPIFLAHARLYTFADMRLVQPLRALALYKLQKTLMVFKLYNRRVSDVLKLARYAYEQGSDRNYKGKVDDLRNLVVEYIVCELDTIGKHKDFRQLMEDGGEFVGDFWDLVRKFLL